jgi:hypothetical protein
MKESQPKDVAEICSQLQEHVEVLCRQLLPQGRRIGQQWRAGWLHSRVEIHSDGSVSCPIWDGGETQVRVELSGNPAGTWADNESGKQGDAFELVKVVCGLEAPDALEWCVAWLSGKPLPPHPAILRLARLIAKGMAEDAINQDIISQDRRKK